MENSIYRFCLDIHKTTAQCNLDVKKGDTARELLITLTENGKPYLTGEDCRAVFTARKADGNYLYNECEIKDNTVKYVFTEQTAAAEGVMQCEIALYGADGALITSPCFDICVDGTVYNGDEIVSSPEADALKEATEKAEEATEKAEAAAQSAEEKIKQLDVDLSGKQDKFGEVNFGVGTGIKLIGDSSYVIYRQKNGDPARVKGAAPAELDDFANKQYVDKKLDGKVDKEDGKGLSSNDYTDEDKALLQSAVQPDTLNSALSADKAYTDDTFAPVINNTANGINALRVDDVSSIAHEMAVRVSSKNILPFPYFQNSLTDKGITYTVNTDGTVTANGTATGNNFSEFVLTVNQSWKTKQKYTISGCPAGGSTTTYFICTYSGRADIGSGVTTDYSDLKRVSIRILSGTTVENLVFKPQIELGTAATPYTPYISDLSSVSVSRYGKNLWCEDSSYTLPSQWNSYYTFVTFRTNSNIVALLNRLTGQFLAISYDTDIDLFKNRVEVVLHFTDNDNIVLNRTTRQIPTGKTIKSIEVRARSDSSEANGLSPTITNIQLELGTTATPHTPYILPQTVQSDENGNIEGLTSVSPDMTLMSDTDGVIIDCEYKADTKRYIDNQINNKFAELQAAVINAGGNI